MSTDGVVAGLLRADLPSACRRIIADALRDVASVGHLGKAWHKSLHGRAQPRVVRRQLGEIATLDMVSADMQAEVVLASAIAELEHQLRESVSHLRVRLSGVKVAALSVLAKDPAIRHALDKVREASAALMGLLTRRSSLDEELSTFVRQLATATDPPAVLRAILECLARHGGRDGPFVLSRGFVGLRTGWEKKHATDDAAGMRFRLDCLGRFIAGTGWSPDGAPLGLDGRRPASFDPERAIPDEWTRPLVPPEAAEEEPPEEEDEPEGEPEDEPERVHDDPPEDEPHTDVEDDDPPERDDPEPAAPPPEEEPDRFEPPPDGPEWTRGRIRIQCERGEPPDSLSDRALLPVGSEYVAGVDLPAARQQRSTPRETGLVSRRPRTDADGESTIDLVFVWKTGERHWWLRAEFPESIYDRGRALPRFNAALSPFLFEPEGRQLMRAISLALQDLAERSGLTGVDAIDLLVKLGQHLGYAFDIDTTGHDEFPRSPVEALTDGHGDCEDAAMLVVALTEHVPGVSPAFLRMPNHIAVGLAGVGVPGGKTYEDRGVAYTFVEATNPFAIGEVPSSSTRELERLEPATLQPYVEVASCRFRMWDDGRRELLLGARNVGFRDADNVVLELRYLGEGGAVVLETAIDLGPLATGDALERTIPMPRATVPVQSVFHLRAGDYRTLEFRESA